MSRRENLDCKVYVGSLSHDVDEKDVEKAFGYYGAIRSVWIARKPAGFGFVEFEDRRDADDAIRGLDGSSIGGCRVRVEQSTGKVRDKGFNRRGGGGGGYSGGRGGGYNSRDRGYDSRDRGYDSRKPFDPDDKCYECGEKGHYAYDCAKRSRGSARSRSPRRNRSYSRSRSRSQRHSRSRSRSVSRDRDLIN